MNEKENDKKMSAPSFKPSKRQKLDIDDNDILIKFANPQLSNGLLIELARHLDNEKLWAFCNASVRFYELCLAENELKSRFVAYAEQLDSKSLFAFCRSSKQIAEFCKNNEKLDQRVKQYVQCSHRNAALRRTFDFLKDQKVSTEWRKFLITKDDWEWHIIYQDEDIVIRAIKENNQKFQILMDTKPRRQSLFLTVYFEDNCPKVYELFNSSNSEQTLDLRSWRKIFPKAFYGFTKTNEPPLVFTPGQSGEGRNWKQFNEMVFNLYNIVGK